jgi:hypothetical protein
MTFRVSGPNTADGRMELWYFPTRKDADYFAKFICGETGKSYEVLQHIGTWCVEKPRPPVKFVKAALTNRRTDGL